MPDHRDRGAAPSLWGAVLALVVVAAVVAPAPGASLVPSEPSLGYLAVEESASGGDESRFERLIYSGAAAVNPGWVASVQQGGAYTCTGSLVHPEWVLTAAHCADEPGSYSVSVGGAAWWEGVALPVIEVRIHPGWAGRTGDPDLAMLRLASRVDGTPLPRLASRPDLPGLGQALSVYGWGETQPGSGPSTTLRFTSVLVTSDSSGAVDEDYCLRDFVAPSGYQDFCFGGTATAWSCRGDSGGPLVGPRDPADPAGPVDTIYGIVSGGYPSECDTWVYDDVAARVGANIDWVRSAIPSGRFVDDDGNLHEPNIEAIAAAGITQGCGPALYCPTAAVTRAQMASFLARAFGYPAATRDYFPDDAGSVHEADINRLAEAGVTLGYADGTYRPDRPVTREEMASFLARALALAPIPGTRFADVSGPREPDINAIAQAGITQGCSADGTRFCPVDPVLRDQMASFLTRALGLAPIIP